MWTKTRSQPSFSTMAVSMQSKSVMAARAAPQARCVRVCASSGMQRVQAVATTLAAAALLVAPAHAGVQLVQPKIKSALFDNTTVEEKKEREAKSTQGGGFSFFGAPSAPGVKAEKVDSVPISDGGIDPRVIALPGSLVIVAGLAFVWPKVDEDFDEFMDKAACKNSRRDATGLGYEDIIKATSGGIYGPIEKVKVPVAAKSTMGGGGTKKIKAGTKPTKGKGTGFTLPFGLKL
ncbi:hypothetical protein FOA52_011768 [Chlamydomonas sp. UWO 241]|nr:hypothetical protein FOA52_011768 [Chlamydomonas sp. UWO 241]